MRAEDICWETGNYTDECCCECCVHQYDCSGNDNGDYDDEGDNEE